ncbi:FtsX-like permease family protein [Flavobacterium sp. NST-5]|uniref:FtsX-like permease family protein n=1 Tax=Flavobacterium ichthyis TaxID=2698827 RepID=A0ABW9ZBG0_9FLAO|nr:ABC transporter permease [Flavobacterium ichthyis]NBL65924.1 FtsX-like permease family protein [Flavobacterium ichthyis]
MFKNWLKIYLHQIKTNKLFTALNVLGLSLGISGVIFGILYWNDEHEYNAWNPEKDHVFQVVNEVSPGMFWNTNVAALDWHLGSFKELESHCYTRNYYFNEVIKYNGKKAQLAILDAQNTFFRYFPFEFTQGSRENALQDKTSIALSQEAAAQLFGKENPIGKTVEYSGRKLVVKGVYKIPSKSSYAPEVVTNLIDEFIKKEGPDNWGNYSYGLLVKLKNPNQADLVKQKISNLFFENSIKVWAKEEGLSPENYIKKYGRITPILEPLATARLHSVTNGYPEGRGNYQFLLIMMGLSILILVLSIVNYVNLATANAVKRAKEVGVRKILGASKKNIVYQFIFETVMTTLFAILLALLIVELSLPYYNDFLNKKLVLFGSEFFIQLIIIFIIVVIVSGIFPAMYVSNFESLKVLKGNFGRSKSGIWLRNSMLVLQFAIATFFIVGSYIVFEQVDFLTKKDLGFQGEQVLNIFYRKPDESSADIIYSRYHTIKQEMQKIKGVQSVSAGAFSIGNGSGSSSSFRYKEINIQGQNMAMDFEMPEVLGIKLASGRFLSEKFASDTLNSMMINETAAKMMGEKNPVGKEVDWNENKLKIVGVVKDFHMYGPQAEIPPMVFFHFKTIDWMSYNLNSIYVKIDTENMPETIANIEDFWGEKVDPEYPLQYDFVDKSFARTYESYVKQRNLFSLLNFVVILIALFGLFALASYSIQRKMKDIAIRKTLGAETKTLLKELSVQYIVFCVIGFILAVVPIYVLLSKWLENFAYRIEISVIPFIVGFLGLMLLTLIVVLSRAFQATKVQVLKYLKYE